MVKAGPTPESFAASGTEAGHQMAIFCWAQQNEHLYPELKMMFHIPNGGYRDKITGGRLKAQGVKAGVPDIFLPCDRYGWHGLFVELKVGKNILSKEQEEWFAKLVDNGYCVVIAYGYEEAKKQILQYLGV